MSPLLFALLTYVSDMVSKTAILSLLLVVTDQANEPPVAVFQAFISLVIVSPYLALRVYLADLFELNQFQLRPSFVEYLYALRV